MPSRRVSSTVEAARPVGRDGSASLGKLEPGACRPAWRVRPDRPVARTRVTRTARRRPAARADLAQCGAGVADLVEGAADHDRVGVPVEQGQVLATARHRARSRRRRAPRWCGRGAGRRRCGRARAPARTPGEVAGVGALRAADVDDQRSGEVDPEVFTQCGVELGQLLLRRERPSCQPPDGVWPPEPLYNWARAAGRWRAGQAIVVAMAAHRLPDAVDDARRILAVRADERGGHDGALRVDDVLGDGEHRQPPRAGRGSAGAAAGRAARRPTVPTASRPTRADVVGEAAGSVTA